MIVNQYNIFVGVTPYAMEKCPTVATKIPGRVTITSEHKLTDVEQLIYARHILIRDHNGEGVLWAGHEDTHLNVMECVNLGGAFIILALSRNVAEDLDTLVIDVDGEDVDDIYPVPYIQCCRRVDHMEVMLQLPCPPMMYTSDPDGEENLFYMFDFSFEQSHCENEQGHNVPTILEKYVYLVRLMALFTYNEGLAEFSVYPPNGKVEDPWVWLERQHKEEIKRNGSL